jgi:hypothetical protein
MIWIYPDLQTRKHAGTYTSSFLCLYGSLVTLSVFTATCATPTASYHPTGLEDNLSGMPTKEEQKITNIKELGIKTAVSLVVPNYHQPKP